MERRIERDVDQEPYSQGKSDKRRKKRRVIEVWNKNELVSVDEADYGVFEFLRSASEKRPKGVHKPRIGTALRRDCPIEYSTAGKQKRICGLNISSRNFSLGLLEKASCLSALKTFRAHTSSLEFLPPSIGSWQNLEVLDLTGNRLFYLPKEIGNLSNLRTLNLRGSGISWLPASIGSLQKLDKLDISCNSLEDLPRNIGTAVNLKKLQLEDNKLRSLPTSIGNLKNLETLDLTNNHLQDLPHEIGGLKNLKTMELYGNRKLRSLPRSIGNLKALEYLRVRMASVKCDMINDMIAEMINSNKHPAIIDVFHDEICELSGERRLDGWVSARGSFLEALLVQIVERGILKHFRDSGFTKTGYDIDDSGRVSKLHLRSPNFIYEVPPSIGDLTHLKTLHIRLGSNLPTEIGQLHRLEELRLFECQLLPSLPSEIGNLSSLRQLEIDDCQTLQFLPPSIGRLQSLETLILINVPLISQLPIEELRSVEKLKVQGTSISSLPPAMYNSSSLRILTLDFFHPSIATLPNLMNLNLFDVKDLSDFAKVVGNLNGLKLLSLNNCPIPSCIGQLEIEVLLVSRSEDLKTLPDEIGDLDSLQILALYHLGGMEILPSCIFRLKNLKRLDLTKMENLSTIPDAISNLSKLKKLELHDLGLTALPHSIGKLRNLEFISASNLGSLSTVPEDILHELVRNKARKRMGSMIKLMNSKMWPRFIEHAGRAFEFDKRDSDNKLQMNWSNHTSVYQLLVAGRESFLAAIANRSTLGKRKR